MDQTSPPTPESCPRCRQKGETRKLKYVYYNRTDAFSTCENRMCAYFVTDRRGNPVRYRFDVDLKRTLPINPPAKEENLLTELEEQITSLSKDYVVPQNFNENFSLPVSVNSSNVVPEDFRIDDSAFNHSNALSYDLSFLDDLNL